MTYFEIKKESKSTLEKRLDEIENRINNLEYHDRWTNAENNEHNELTRERIYIKEELRKR